ncbi:MAG: hypothetical protein JRF64_11585 [Deltaproteobacteria bacterium]|nr:hypothetical protein [Deltaproteobacteria bacterium]
MSEKTFESRILDSHGDASLLCQPDGERGCGGCCTNFSQPRHILEKVFSVRKEAYDAWVQSEDDMLLYRKKMDLVERGTRQCRFLSFLDDRNCTTGCLLHEDMDWYEYSRLFSFYVDLNGTKGLFDIYVRHTRPLYEAVLQRVSWTDLQGKGFMQQYNRLIRSMVSRGKPSTSGETEEDGVPFHYIMKILDDRRRVNLVNEEIDRFVRVLGE